MAGPYQRKVHPNKPPVASDPPLDVAFLMGAGRAVNLRKVPAELPEIAMVGRSNVGKSTLINRLFQRKALARVSKTPGRTQEVNFFQVNDRLMVADLPGYGFARTAKQMRSHWDELVRAYFDRRCITDLVFLTDARRDLIDEDFAILKHISARARVWVVMTKADKLLQKERKPTIEKMQNLLESEGLAPEGVVLIGTGFDRELAELRHNLFFRVEPEILEVPTRK